MGLILELKNLQNKKLELQEKLKKQNLKIGDKVNFICYKPFVGYKIKKAKIIDTNVSTYDTSYDYKLKLKNGKKKLADNIEVELITALEKKLSLNVVKSLREMLLAYNEDVNKELGNTGNALCDEDVDNFLANKNLTGLKSYRLT